MSSPVPASLTVWEWIDDAAQAVASFGWTPTEHRVRAAENFADWWSMQTDRPTWITVRHAR